jgi:uncharacterized protein
MKQQDMHPLIIYHANCLDGFGAAYAAYCYFQTLGLEGEYYPASHGEQPPQCDGRDVYILDFSYKRPLLKTLCQQATHLTILDHHISAEQELAGLTQEHANLTVLFDMQRSGAIITWEYFHLTPPPPLLRHIQDRDLWRFHLPDSAAVNAALMSYPFTFDTWNQLSQESALPTLISEGEAINRYRRQMIERYKKKVVIGTVAGYHVPVVNCPASITSELLGELAQDYPFAASYEDKGERRGWSLRSRGEHGADVAAIAQAFGGGGHRNAAGFSTPLSPNAFVLVPHTGLT